MRSCVQQRDGRERYRSGRARTTDATLARQAHVDPEAARTTAPPVADALSVRFPLVIHFTLSPGADGKTHYKPAQKLTSTYAIPSSSSPRKPAGPNPQLHLSSLLVLDTPPLAPMATAPLRFATTAYRAHHADQPLPRSLPIPPCPAPCVPKSSRSISQDIIGPFIP